MPNSTPLIVMVDDDAAVVQLVTAFLEVHDYRCASCFNSSEAVALIEETKPALALLDIQMEHWDAGLQVLANLRQNETTSNLPVIICSANLPLLRRQAQQIWQMGAEILEKPYTLDALLARVDAALGRPPRPEPMPL